MGRRSENECWTRRMRIRATFACFNLVSLSLHFNLCTSFMLIFVSFDPSIKIKMPRLVLFRYKHIRHLYSLGDISKSFSLSFNDCFVIYSFPPGSSSLISRLRNMSKMCRIVGHARARAQRPDQNRIWKSIERQMLMSSSLAEFMRSHRVETVTFTASRQRKSDRGNVDLEQSRFFGICTRKIISTHSRKMLDRFAVERSGPHAKSFECPPRYFSN